MIGEVLNLFPAHIHPLSLVSDPDRLLAGEAVIVELAQRGFQVVQENDPVLLRHRLEELRPISTEQAVVIITTGKLEDLPYDLYQPAYRLTLSLHTYFPNLSYPVLQTLSPEQVEKLGSCFSPTETLGRQKTIDFLLREVFNADPAALSQTHALVGWLNDYHKSQSSLPEPLRSGLVERLKRYAVYQDWKIETLLRDSQTFSDFVQQQWQNSIDQSLVPSSKPLSESGSGYYLGFGRDAQLQDLVPALVRQGFLQPLEIPNRTVLPAWTYPGVTLKDTRLQRLAMLLEQIENSLGTMEAIPMGWSGWSTFAKDWAELCSLQYQSGLKIKKVQKETFRRLIVDVDQKFSSWLKGNYTPLGAQKLPRPHHVHHVPHYLAHLRDQGKLERAALFVLDGLSLSDWQVIQPVWAKRNAQWEIKTDTLLAQVPTITSISRYALISGLRPADFAGDLEHCMPEARAWELFWSREGIAGNACKLLPLSFERGIDQMPELQDGRINWWCLIDVTPDKLAHHAALGGADQQSSLRLWLDPAQDQNSIPLEKMIDSFLERGYAVFIASDHGHVEASGFGSPSEGLVAQTRGKRARIYMDRLAAVRVQTDFPDTVLWENDGILPDQMAALMPVERNAFAQKGEVLVTHGGISIDEVMVPFIRIISQS
ncbi:MAG: BREX-3 system phosphatase PglZ [Anaerolineaceae bacterium]|nr:BREX-3 system phosphatase PglZ [Anaerolineaceae bacterium]